MFSGRAATVARHNQVESLPGVRKAKVTAAGGRSFPLEVDGDYLGERDEVVYGVRPRALRVGA